MEISERQRLAQEKFVILYDTAKKCLLIVDHLFLDLESQVKLATAEGVQDKQSITIGLYVSALGLIDYFHRFYQILDAMPLLSKKMPEFKKLRKMIAPVTECRDYLQHIRNDLSEHYQITYPILGSISWICDGFNYTMFAGQPTAKCHMPGIAYDRVLDRFVCKYQITVGSHEIHLDSVYVELKSFWKWLDEHTVINPAYLKTYEWGRPNIIKSWFSSSPAFEEV